VLDEVQLVDKIVNRRRGGFCYELNGAFAALLRALGYEVELLAARVFGDGDVLTPPFDHMALRVHADEPVLADVGFGRFIRRPVRWESRTAQQDPDGVVRLADVGDGDVDVLLDDQPQYRMERRPRRLADFAPTCWWQQTSPDSHFTRSTTCSLLTSTGRITLSGNRLIRTEHDERSERELPDDAVLDGYREHFGIELDRVPLMVG
jgi:N-hydroxyarylamine O-acetyltransferase